MTSFRRPTTEDGELVLRAIDSYLQVIQKRSRKAWVKDISKDKVIDAIGTDDLCFIVDEHYLVMYELGIPWHSETLLLNERLVLALRPGGDFQSVTEFLTERATYHGAKYVIVGTALAIVDRALARLYEGLGFQRTIITLTKEVPIG